MHLLSADTIFSGKIAQALCWMLVHSLWIGLALTVVTGVIMLSTKRQTAALRYNLLVSSFLLFTIAMIVVFALQISATANSVNEQLAASTAVIIKTVDDSVAANITESNSSFAASITVFFNQYATVIVLLWFLIIVFRCMQLIAGMLKLKQIKTNQLTVVGDYWLERIRILSIQLNIKTPVTFFQSGIATIPMVAGYFKPIILFPAGLLTALPPEEVEAILIHEMAHILRKDYLVNLLQHFVEILFFFNPAILWVSSLIKIERENCCDDIAIAQTSSKRNYINALVSFQEYHLNTPGYATAFAGNKKHLLERVKRMLYNNNKTLNAMEKTFLTLCFIVVTSLMVVFSQTKPSGTTINNNASAKDTTISIADRHYDPKDFEEGATVAYYENNNGVLHKLTIYKRKGILYELYGDVTSFKINGKKIPQQEWSKYKKLMSELMKDNDKEVIAEPAEQMEQEQALAKQDKLAAEQDALAAQQDKLAAEQDKLAEEKDKLTAEKDNATTQQDNLIAEKDNAIAEQDKLEAEKRKADATIRMQTKKEQEKEILKWQADKRKMEKDQLKAQEDKRKAEQEKIKADKKNKTTGIDNRREQQLIVDNVTNSTLSYATNNTSTPPVAKSYKLTGIQSNGSAVVKDMDIEKVTQNLINDLINEQVISSTAGLSYKMSNKTLIVNGKVQPESLHQKLKSKYIQSPDWKLLYNWSTN